jgi:hypothetical protein
MIKLMRLLVKDCICVVAPCPFRIEPLEDFDPIGYLDVAYYNHDNGCYWRG